MKLFINADGDLSAKIGDVLVSIPVGYGSAREIYAYWVAGQNEFAQFDNKVMARIIESLIRQSMKASVGNFHEMESRGDGRALCGPDKPANYGRTRNYV